MQVRRRLTEFESTIAMLVGSGLIVLILAFLLASARGGSQSPARILGTLPVLDVMIIGGLLLLVGGTIAWLAVKRPWETEHDDWSTPLYTGHDEHHEAAPAHGETGELAAEPYAHATEIPAEGAGPAAARMAAPETPEVVTADTPDRAPLIPGELPAGAPLALVPEVNPPDTLAADVVVTDDLTVVEGIGPKIKGALAEAGITTFAQLAAQEPEELERIVRAAGVRMVGKALHWPEQARLLAEGRLEEWKALAARLKSGR